MKMRLAIICPQLLGLKHEGTVETRLIANYLRMHMTFLIKRNIPKKLKLLKAQASFPLFSDEKFLYKEIDLERCKGVKLAEKKCHKLRMGQVSFSQELQQTRRKIRAWHLLGKRVKDLHTSSRLLCRYYLRQICHRIQEDSP